MQKMKIELSIKKKLFTATGEFSLNAQLKIDHGEMVSFFGPSGVGKTTILRIIAGLTEADEGYLKVGDSLWFDTRKGYSLSPRKRKVGFVFQDYALFPNMNVRDNIRFAQEFPDKEYIKELIDIFGLTVLQNRKPSMLSGGQRQRVALARALARKPGILLLDEPLSALDHETRIVLQDEILKVHKLWGITTILVSHDLTEVFRLCNRIIVLKHGRIVEDGHPNDIFDHSKISGKIQFIAEVLKVENNDFVNIITLLVGNSPVKVAVCNSSHEHYIAGDKVLVVSKAFNPILQKI